MGQHHAREARKDRDALLKEDNEKKQETNTAQQQVVRRPVANRELLDLEANIRRIEGEIAARELELICSRILSRPMAA